MRKKMHRIRKFFKQTARRWSWAFYRKRKVEKQQYKDLIKGKENVKLHLGCGDKRFEGYINIDIVPPEGSDMLMDVTDLSIIPSDSVSEIFMKSVFEHLYNDEQEKALGEYYRVLKNEGRLTIKVPDFDAVVGAYLRKEKGIVSEVFDFDHVRQYVCGELVPENRVPSVHKDIFNKERLRKLLEEKKFFVESIKNVVFEDQRLALTIEAVAVKK